MNFISDYRSALMNLIFEIILTRKIVNRQEFTAFFQMNTLKIWFSAICLFFGDFFMFLFCDAHFEL